MWKGGEPRIEVEIWDPGVRSQGTDKVRMGKKEEKKVIIDKTLVITNIRDMNRRRLRW